MKKYKHLPLVLAEGLGKEAYLHLKMMETPTGPRALGSDCMWKWE